MTWPQQGQTASSPVSQRSPQLLNGLGAADPDPTVAYAKVGERRSARGWAGCRRCQGG